MTPARRAARLAQLQRWADASSAYRPTIGFSRLPPSALTDEAQGELRDLIARDERVRRAQRSGNRRLAATGDHLAQRLPLAAE